MADTNLTLKIALDYIQSELLKKHPELTKKQVNKLLTNTLFKCTVLEEIYAMADYILGIKE